MKCISATVPRSAFKDFCITRLGRLSAPEARTAKTEDGKRVKVFKEGAGSPLPVNYKIWGTQ